jgi:hypothetical protein
MRTASLGLLAAAALATLGAAPAQANTLFYAGTIAGGDKIAPFLPVDTSGPSQCGTAASPTLTGVPPNSVGYDLYAFRNAGSSATCITVTGQNASTSAFTFDVTGGLDPADSLFGADSFAFATTHAHSVTVPAGHSFAEFVFGLADGRAYGLAVGGDTTLVPVNALAASAQLPASNTLAVHATVPKDDPAGATGIDGTLTDTAGPGHRYSGPVRCLRVDGDKAALVMTFDGTQEGLASKWKGAVYWLHQSIDGTTDGQRNSLLTQRQLDTTYANCPNPDTPLGKSPASYQTISGTGAVTVVDTPDQAAA